MNEKYLHFLWKMKRLPFPNLTLHNSKEFRILDFGTYNEFESGPDFQGAAIVYDDLNWFGSIELHVNASDWYKHKHQFDTAYDNVILHVVYNYDKDVSQNGRLLPTLELKNHIDQVHYSKFQYLETRPFDIPCQKSILGIPNRYLENMSDRAMENRLNRKCLELEKVEFLDETHLLYILFARSFGSHINQQPFESLAISFDLQQFLTIPRGLRAKIMEQYAGFSSMEDLKFIDSKIYQWRLKGIRPHNTPKNQIQLFSDFISEFDFSIPFWNFSTQELIHHFHSYKVLLKKKSLLQNILINAIPLFLYWKAKHENNSHYISLAVELLKLLPTENNYITRKWFAIGIVSKNAFESQSNLEIYKQFCTRKRCLNCTIGIKILNQ